MPESHRDGNSIHSPFPGIGLLFDPWKPTGPLPQDPQVALQEEAGSARGATSGLNFGSPCATLFITVLVLRLLTKNRCDSISYQRACGPRQGGNFDNPIFPLTLPKGVSQVEP